MVWPSPFEPVWRVSNRQRRCYAKQQLGSHAAGIAREPREAWWMVRWPVAEAAAAVVVL